jgi:hypothetical protein
MCSRGYRRRSRRTNHDGVLRPSHISAADEHERFCIAQQYTCCLQVSIERCKFVLEPPGSSYSFAPQCLVS